MALFKRVTIVGLGLIGGSLGMAIRSKRLARQVVGLSRTRRALWRAKRLDAIDIGTTNAKQGVRDADLVILATPVDFIVPSAKRLAGFMSAGSVVMDVGSAKGTIVRALEGRLPHGVAFVGAHPLAGSEQQGIAAAKPELFDESGCIVTATAHTDRRALGIVRHFWRRLGCQVVVMDPATHDRLLAVVSHLPHLLAFCLVAATDHRALQVAPRSFLEATRVAKSDPDLWDDILFSNRAALLKALDRLTRHLGQARTVLARADRPALQRFLRRANRLRHRLHDC